MRPPGKKSDFDAASNRDRGESSLFEISLSLPCSSTLSSAQPDVEEMRRCRQRGKKGLLILLIVLRDELSRKKGGGGIIEGADAGL